MPWPDKNLKTIRINDFTPGIVQFSRGSYLQEFTPEAPVGSAASCFRCIARPGIGLIPFPSYIARMSSLPVATPPVGDLTLTGFLAAGPIVDTGGATVFPQADVFTDAVFIAFEYSDGASTHRVVQRLNAEKGAPTVTSIYDTVPGGLKTYFFGKSFARTRLPFNGTNFFGLAIVWDDSNRLFTSPDINNQANDSASVAFPFDNIFATFTHESRIVGLGATGLLSGTVGAYNAIEDLVLTDPPETLTFAATPDFFDIENATGYGAWGSISSGELVLVRNGAGALIVNGDLIAPSSVTKLPGVVGTGRAMQRGTNSPQGLIYCTEYDGVYSWNGGNTSQKISNNIPDDAMTRAELSGQIVGISHIHDCVNNWVFFPNNWVFDCLTNSWWVCEDPFIVNFAAFSRGSMNARFMWGMPGIASGGALETFTLYAFDMLTPASSWEWISNPLPVTTGELVTIFYCEIVASNPTQSDCTIQVTPTTPGNYNPINAGNNPQAATFTIPALSSGIRLSQPLGYTDYNAQIQIIGINSNSAESAPTLHEVSLGWNTNALTASN